MKRFPPGPISGVNLKPEAKFAVWTIQLAGSLTAFALIFASSSAAFADDNNSSTGDTRLDGGVQKKETMQSSAKLLVTPRKPPAPRQAPREQYNYRRHDPIRSNVQQFSGSAEYMGDRQIRQQTHVLPVEERFARPRFQQGISGFGDIDSMRMMRHRRFPRPMPYIPYTMTPRNGIMTWDSSYATHAVPQVPRYTTSTSLRFSHGSNSSVGLLAHQSSLERKPVLNYFTPPAAAPTIPELRAVEKVLPQQRMAPPTDWNDWYQRVVKAVYGQWTQNDLGAGQVTLQVNVYSGRYVDTRVLSFTQAIGADPNAPAEEAFREASLRAVTSLDGSPIWTFPLAAQTTKKVAFDIELDHAVGEIPGCKVVRKDPE